MKKIILVVGIIFAILTLTSCSSSVDYTYNIKAASNVLATNWLDKDNVFSFGAMDEEVGDAANSYNKDASHVRVFLPTDISSSLRVNYVSLGDRTVNTTSKVDMSYAFTSSSLTDEQKNLFAEACASVVNDTSSDNLVKAAFSEATASETFDNPVLIDDSLDNSDLYAVTVFMPVITKYYIEHGDSIERNNFSYTLVPIYSKLVNKVNGEFPNLDSSITSLEEIKFTTNNLVVDTLN